MKQELIISYTENMDVFQEERKFMQIFQRERIGIVAGWIGMRFIAPMTFKGGCDKEVFNIWLEKPKLPLGTTIVMDNATFHKTTKTKSLIESFGCHVLYLPTYSPDLNPHFYPQV
ncbi:transposase [Wolbachia endosymbiont of Tetranychus urticae]|uniref:transposase n=1 Tax=Wolbachia endosymbiont of Tetranychus urticae TaxID=169184 RepID=UPI003978720C